MKKAFSIQDRLHSFSHAIRGLIKLFKTEHNSRVHLTVTIIAVILGVVLKVTVV